MMAGEEDPGSLMTRLEELRRARVIAHSQLDDALEEVTAARIRTERTKYAGAFDKQLKLWGKSGIADLGSWGVRDLAAWVLQAAKMERFGQSAANKRISAVSMVVKTKYGNDSRAMGMLVGPDGGRSPVLKDVLRAIELREYGSKRTRLPLTPVMIRQFLAGDVLTAVEKRALAALFFTGTRSREVLHMCTDKVDIRAVGNEMGFAWRIATKAVGWDRGGVCGNQQWALESGIRTSGAVCIGMRTGSRQGVLQPVIWGTAQSDPKVRCGVLP